MITNKHQARQAIYLYQIGARIDKDLNELVEKARGKEGRSRSNFMKMAIKKYAEDVLQKD
jgi:uncharacterized protein (DUF1778 family)